MIKIWGFSFLLFKLKIQQFRGLGMTCEWMRRHRNYIVISSRWNIRFSQNLLISNTKNLLTRLLKKTPPARLDSEYFRKDLLKTSLSFCGLKETLLNLKYVIFFCFRTQNTKWLGFSDRSSSSVRLRYSQRHPVNSFPFFLFQKSKNNLKNTSKEMILSDEL